MHIDFFAACPGAALRFHPLYRPPLVRFDAAGATARCTYGPRSIALWGLSRARPRTFALHVTGGMTTLGVVDAGALDALADVRTLTRDACGGAGRPGDYARPSHHFEPQGRIDVDFDAAARLAVIRAGPHVVVFSGFAPDALFAVTLYAGGEVTILDAPPEAATAAASAAALPSHAPWLSLE